MYADIKDIIKLNFSVPFEYFFRAEFNYFPVYITQAFYNRMALACF